MNSSSSSSWFLDHARQSRSSLPSAYGSIDSLCSSTLLSALLAVIRTGCWYLVWIVIVTISTVLVARHVHSLDPKASFNHRTSSNASSQWLAHVADDAIRYTPTRSASMSGMWHLAREENDLRTLLWSNQKRNSGDERCLSEQGWIQSQCSSARDRLRLSEWSSIDRRKQTDCRNTTRKTHVVFEESDTENQYNEMSSWFKSVPSVSFVALLFFWDR